VTELADCEERMPSRTMTFPHSSRRSSVQTQVNRKSSDSVSSTSMIVNGNSSLVSMKTRCRRATGLRLERGAQRIASGASLLALGSDIHDILHTYATVVAVG